MIAKEVINALKTLATEDRRKTNEWFFKTNKGQYGYGDIFLGVCTPDVRDVAKKFNQTITLKELTDLIKCPIHEVRLCALIILVNKYNKEKSDRIYQYYLKHLNSVNNWDLVDVTCLHVIGKHLMDRDRSILYSWAKSDDLWTRRIAMISTFWFIRKNDLDDTFTIAEILLNDEHDLIHKAVGWMLREAGKRDLEKEEIFLKKHYKNMPRTMLRYLLDPLLEHAFKSF